MRMISLYHECHLFVIWNSDNNSCFMFKNVQSIHNSSFGRQQDVRATEIDKVDMHLSFRPGDIVRALVVLLLL